MSNRVVIDRDYVRSVAAEIRDLAAQGLEPLYQPPGGGQELTDQMAAFGSDVRLCMTKEAQRLEELAADCEAAVRRAEDLDQQAEVSFGEAKQPIAKPGVGPDLMEKAYADWNSTGPVNPSTVESPGGLPDPRPTSHSGQDVFPEPNLTDPSWPGAHVRPVWEDNVVDQDPSDDSFPEPAQPEPASPRYERPVDLHLPKQPSVLSKPPAGDA